MCSVKVALFRGGSETAAAAANALTDLHHEWRAKLQENISASVESRSAQDAEYQKFKGEFTELLDAQKRAADESAERLDRIIESGTTKLENITTTYDAKLSLQAPITYWSAKRKYHRLLRKTAGRMALWYGLLAFALVILAAWFLFSGEASQVAKVPLWHIAVFGTLITVLVWIGRILVRTYLSNTHLESDAYERSTIASTALALMR